MTETHEHRIKRLAMRSMRRGTKEMDILLMRFADAHLSQMTADELDLYDALLGENDQDLYLWISGQAMGPDVYAQLIKSIAETTAPTI